MSAADWLKIVKRPVFKYSLAVITAGLVFAALFLPDWLIANRIEKAQKRFKDEYNLDLRLTHYERSSLTGIRINGLTLSNETDTTVKINELEMRLHFWPLLIGRAEPALLTLKGGKVNYSQRYDSTAKSALDSTKSETDSLAQQLAPRLAAFFQKTVERIELIPPTTKIEDVSIAFTDSLDTLQLNLGAFTIENQRISSQFTLNNEPFSLSGELKSSDYLMYFSLHGSGQKFFPFNRLREKWDIALKADSLGFGVKDWSNSSALSFDLVFDAHNIALKNKRLSPDTVLARSVRTKIRLNIQGNEIEVDSSSYINLNDIHAQPYLKFRARPDTLLALGLSTEPCDAQAFLESTPKGMLSKAHTMKLKGRLAYRLNFLFQSTLPDTSTIFESHLSAENFEILDEGKTEISKFRNGFTHRPFRSGRVLRVDSTNPNFVKYSNISEFVKRGVQFAEDGKFFVHQGFSEEGLRLAAARDIRAGRFKSGGSTITMQLVKNIMLTHNKTFARKLEEAFLVWMIENKKLLSKERMMEIYLNIIEWGPEVYGVGEAAGYYFNKPQNKLSLEEALFLAMIVPWPRPFMYHFDPKTDSLIKSRSHFFKRVATVMYYNQAVTKAELDSLKPETVLLKGEALKVLLNRRKSTAPDSVLKDLPIEGLEPTIEGFPTLPDTTQKKVKRKKK